MTRQEIERAARELYDFTGRMAMLDDKASAISAIEKTIIQQVNAALEEAAEGVKASPTVEHAQKTIRALKIPEEK